MSPIIELLDAAQATVEDAVTPGGRAFLVTRVVIVRANILLVGRGESNG